MQQINFTLPMFLWRYCKEKQTSCFGYLLWARLTAHTQNDSIKETSMFICMPIINFINHFFLEILHFKESCNLIGWQHRELEFCQIWDWWWNINNNISFHFRLFPRKTNDKIFLKIKKIFLGQFLALFAQIWAKMNFSQKRGSVSFLIFQLSTISPKIRKKLLSHFWKKTLIDGQVAVLQDLLQDKSPIKKEQKQSQ